MRKEDQFGIWLLFAAFLITSVLTLRLTLRVADLSNQVDSMGLICIHETQNLKTGLTLLNARISRLEDKVGAVK